MNVQPFPDQNISPIVREKSPALATAAPRTLAAIEVRARILYVDSDPEFRRIGAHMLIRSGYAVDTAADGAQVERSGFMICSGA